MLALDSRAEADCSAPRSALVALKYADVVFRGTVREITTVGERGYQNITPGRTEYYPGWTGQIVTFDVTRVWKWTVPKRFVLHTMREQEDDVFPFERGLEYLVFAIENPERKQAHFGGLGPTYGATACGGTMPTIWSVASEYFLQLGVGRVP